MTMNVCLLTPRDDARLVAFLDDLGRASPAALAYHYPFYRDAIAAAGVGEPTSFALEENGAITAVLPGFSRSTDSGTVFASLPFFGPNAGVLTANDGGAFARHRHLLDALRAWMRTHPRPLAASLQTPFLLPDFTAYDTLLPDALVVDRFTQQVDIQAGEWPSKVRYDLRRAVNLGVTVERGLTGEKLDAFYQLYVDNAQAVGIAVKPRAVVDQLAIRGVAEGRVKLYSAWHEGRFVAGLMVLWGPSVVSYYLPCNLDAARSLQPGMLLIDAAVQDARAAGRRWWNWEGSPSRESGVYMFKKRWGSTESAYRTYALPFQPPEIFATLGKERIAAEFPYTFVYPFNRL
jgi:Acetyltransferase (GNAT) domain